MSNYKNNIFYEPKIDYEKKYESIGSTKNHADTVAQDNKKKEDVLKKLNDKLNKIDSVINLLPEAIRDAANKPYEAIKSVIGDIDKIDDSDEGMNIIVNKPTSKDNENKEDYIDDPFFDNEDNIIINTKDLPQDERIEREYNNDLISIIDDYTDDLNSVLNEYYDSLISVLSEIDLSNINEIIEHYDGNTNDVKDEYKHLSDIIIRSQYVRDMKGRMHNKLFSVDNTITHIKMCKATAMQRMRYYKADYIKDDSIQNIKNNTLLEASRAAYDNKYEHNFSNLYKYLHSSVIVLGEIVTGISNEMQAKSILINKRG